MIKRSTNWNISKEICVAALHSQKEEISFQYHNLFKNKMYSKQAYLTKLTPKEVAFRVSVRIFQIWTDSVV